MTEKELMLAGELYSPGTDEELRADFMKARRLTRIFNSMTEEKLDERMEIIKELFGSIGENGWVEQSFHCDYGCNIHVGDNFYANYDCIMLDICKITIGNNVMLAPRVCIYTAGHPIDADVRKSGLEFGSPVTIKDDVWICGNTVINPGVTIGEGTIIGSGSVVTKDIPDHVIAAGNPCRVLRAITEEDKKYWESEREKYIKINQEK